MLTLGGGLTGQGGKILRYLHTANRGWGQVFIYVYRYMDRWIDI